MDINIGEVESMVRAVDGDALLAQQTLAKIVQAVLLAVREQEEHRTRVREEQRINNRLFDDLIGER